MSGPLTEMLEGISALHDETRVLLALSQLCEYLAMANEDSMSGFSPDAFVPPMINCLSLAHNPNIMLFAIRSLTHMMDIQPNSANVVVGNGGVPPLVMNLMNLAYIDLAEAAMQALDKVAHEHAAAIIQEGGMMAVLSHLDFMPMSSQRVAVKLASSLCRSMSSSTMPLLSDTLPTLTNLLNYSDPKILESAILCFSRLASSLYSDEAALTTVTSYGLFNNLLMLIGPEASVSLPDNAFVMVLSTLATFARASPQLATNLMQSGVLAVLRHLIAAEPAAGDATGAGPAPGSPVPAGTPGGTLASPSTMAPTTSASGTAAGRPAAVLFQSLTLASELLPYFEYDFPAKNTSSSSSSSYSSLSRFSSRYSGGLRSSGGYQLVLGKGLESRSAGNEVLDTETGETARLRMLAESELLLDSMVEMLLAPLLGVCATSVNPSVRNGGFRVVGKLVHLASADVLRERLADLPISSFVAALLSERDLTALAVGVSLACMLLAKLPDVFGSYFVQEGVVFELKRLASSDLGSLGTPAGTCSTSKSAFGQASSSGSNNDSKSGTEQATSRSENTPTLREWIATSVSSVLDVVGTLHGAGSGHERTSHLREVAASLNKLPRDSVGAADLGAHVALRNALVDVDGTGTAMVTTFEIISSEVMEQLLEYLTDTAVAPQIALDRLAVFAHVWVNAPRPASVPADAPSPATPQHGYPMLVPLVRKVQEALSKVQTLPVMLHSPPDGNQDLRILTQSFRVAVSPGSSSREAGLSYTASELLVEPLAPLISIEEFVIGKLPNKAVAKARVALGGPKQLPPAPGTTAPGIPRSSSNTAELHMLGSEDEPLAGSSSGAVVDASGASDDYEYDEDEDDDELAGFGDGGGNDEAGEHGAQAVMDLLDAALATQATSPSTAAAASGSASTMAASSSTNGSEGRNETESGERLARGPGLGRKGGSRARPTKGKKKSSSGYNVEEWGGGLGSTASAEPGAKYAAENAVLVLSLNGKELPPSTTVFQAVQAFAVERAGSEDNYAYDDSAEMHRALWDEVYTFEYRLKTRDEYAAYVAEQSAVLRAADDKVAPASVGTPNVLRRVGTPRYAGAAGTQKQAGRVGTWLSPFEHIGTPLAELVGGLSSSSPAFVPLALLKLLHTMVVHIRELVERDGSGYDSPEALTHAKLQLAAVLDSGSGVVASGEFVNQVVTAKLERQMQDPLTVTSGAFPSWVTQLMAGAPFVFPFATRKQFLHTTAFGVARALLQLQENSGATASSGRSNSVMVGRIQRSKVRISRETILSSAFKVLELYAASKSVLEIEYFGESGTGLGPSLEFYTLVCAEVQRADLEMWRTSESKDNKYVVAPHGLFAKPFDWRKAEASGPGSTAAAAGERLLKLFKFMGWLVGKALMDSRLIDLPFAPAMYKVLLGAPLAAADVALFDPVFAASLEPLMRAAEAVANGTPADKVTVDDHGTRVEDLFLVFELPGAPGFALVDGGCEMEVTTANVGQYVDAVVDATIGSGVRPQLDAFLAGVNDVFDLAALAGFDARELEIILMGTDEPWTAADIAAHTVIEHGYEAHSRIVNDLFDVLASFDDNERRQFLKFMTGSPRLPYGGWAALDPPFKIVRKTAAQPDAYMPSTMTCLNYLKLPEYSSAEVLQAKLRQAMTEGQSGFLLS
ncbi:E3 ubiquitin-protein ligase UPL3 [Thecamonas trahens ATCC 50062]|uniref:HECT-type E3 ubiquitin transferase n=1 Tax=Thecamonas trahens ATCC 50062 TaxID=461836 RepID=A0A0L0DGY2_THETB|nr:E3 ubiquitin-protein ligase UPL3 [Thecamonas trahens ATCC 50062]KNC51475.1 E3 ubiquitin-protein ligase UPL3 [Thecamonas trahens ATCC 50062]|eukprot:XP_013756136.1 E3 ubiquitin-protein ligase UPL3 [Thecamonas trahens ATCC 50062]